MFATFGNIISEIIPNIFIPKKNEKIEQNRGIFDENKVIFFW